MIICCRDIILVLPEPVKEIYEALLQQYRVSQYLAILLLFIAIFSIAIYRLIVTSRTVLPNKSERKIPHFQYTKAVLSGATTSSIFTRLKVMLLEFISSYLCQSRVNSPTLHFLQRLCASQEFGAPEHIAPDYDIMTKISSNKNTSSKGQSSIPVH